MAASAARLVYQVSSDDVSPALCHTCSDITAPGSKACVHVSSMPLRQSSHQFCCSWGTVSVMIRINLIAILHKQVSLLQGKLISGLQA